jgi:5S rRNA maturation endonuclease (ribonuclease M5)
MRSKFSGAGSVDDCERLAGIEELIDELKDRALCGAVVLVEGRRDREALEKLGLAGDIVLTSHRSLLNLAEGLARDKKDIIVLTDWDERGEEVARQLSLYLEADGVKPDNGIRGSLRGLLKREITEVENLYVYVENLKEVCSTKPQHY